VAIRRSSTYNRFFALRFSFFTLSGGVKVPIPNYAYFEGKIVPYSEAKIGVMTHAFNYGTAAFGGIRGYWNEAEEQLFIFRPKEHFQRLLHSARMLCMEMEHTPESLTDILLELVRTEGLRRDIYVRPLIYKADEIIGVKLHDLIDQITMFAVPFDRYVSNDTNAHVTFSSWRRVDDNMIPARGKISGAYVNSALIKTDAVRAGFDEALVLTQDGHISEGSAMNVFMIRDGLLVTPPVTDNILEGITRRTVLALAREELGLQIVERQIDRTEVFICEELFMTGTAAQVTAVTRVDFRPVGSGEMGPITTRLREMFGQVVRGQLPRYRHWNTPVFIQEPISG
jgi:branched-chain amino acid aminotransferase